MIEVQKVYRFALAVDAVEPIKNVAQHDRQDVLVTAKVQPDLFDVEALDGATWVAYADELYPTATTSSEKFAGCLP